MKIKAFVIVTLLLVLCRIVSSQSSGESCYAHDNAQLTGNMNIRVQPTTSSAVVGTARSGTSVNVTESQQGTSWCWLRINSGWIAKTSRVSATGTKQTTVTPLVRYSKTPVIEGTSRFVSQVNSVLNILKEEQPSWYDYIVSVTNVIAPKPLGEPYNVSTAYTTTRRIEVGRDHAFYGFRQGEDVYVQKLFLISILVHEACHIHEWYAGRRVKVWELAKKYKEEALCTKKGRLALRRIDSHPIVMEILNEQIKMYEQKASWYGR